MDAPTNILMIDTVIPAEKWQVALEGLGVAMFAVGPHRLRAVLHNDVDDAKLDVAVSAFKKLALEFA